MRATKRRKGPETNMTNAQTNTAATVAEQGATVAPEKASLKQGARHQTRELARLQAQAGSRGFRLVPVTDQQA